MIRKHPKKFVICWVVIIVGECYGIHIIFEYLIEVSPAFKTACLILGVPCLFALILLILYILWKIWKGIGWLMDQPSYGSWWGSIWVPNPFERFLNTLANNKVVINIETSKSKLEAKTESEDNTDPDTITSPVSGKDV